MPRQPKEKPKCLPTSEKSPLRAAIDGALAGEKEQLDGDSTASLLTEYLDAPEHANVSVMVSALISRPSSYGSRYGNTPRENMELPSALLPPL